MRLLHVIHSVDPRSGGPSTVIRGLVEAQIRGGHEVAVLATSVQSAEPWLPGPVFLAKMRADPSFSGAELQILPAWGRRRLPSQFGFSPLCTRWLGQRLSDPASRPDVVHIHGVFSHVTTAAASRCRAKGVPYVVRPAGSLDSMCRRMRSGWLKAVFWRLYLKRDLRRAACVQATSPAEAEELRRRLPRARIETIAHGASLPAYNNGALRQEFLARFPRLQDRRIILCLARIHAIKRPELLVQAVALLRARLPGVALVFAGHDAGHKAILDKLIRRLGVDDLVVFTGFLEGKLKQSALASAELFALPSQHENLGVAVVEAMAHGVPILVTPQVASHVHVDAAGAGLTVAGRPEAVADGIWQLLHVDREAMGGRGREYVRQHLAWPKIARQVEKLYQWAVANGSRADEAP